MEIVDVHEVLDEVRYLNAARHGRTEVTRLPIRRATARGLPAALDALIIASDLQGIVPDPQTREATLLGVAVAETLAEICRRPGMPRAARTGVVLAGDLYSVPSANERGGFGDVAPVWEAFAERFAWVVGVAGNHDDVRTVGALPDVHLLDGRDVALDGLTFGGVGLIAGNPKKPGRRSEDEQLTRIEAVTAEALDVLILHEGPEGERERDQPGHPVIREIVERHKVPLTICGHVHWTTPLARHAAGQILNVDARVVLLVRAP